MAVQVPGQTRGEIITFYSYKGGTGRTMAMANVACLLAEQLAPDEKLLIIDWDLEAPGLHRFFPGRYGQASAAMDLGLDANPGLIDLFTALEAALPKQPAESEEAADAALATAFADLSFDQFIRESGVPRVHILRAGRNDDGQYSRRVNTFNWEDLFRRVPSVYQQFGERLAGRFRYVLIDSRTGVTDISGICTSLLPEKLVVVFTPNRQSLTGVNELIGQATSYRRASDDLRPLLVFPLPSRIEASLEDLRAHWRFGNRDLDIAGYQPTFEAALAEAYGLQRCDLKAYFDDVQVQQTPDYAYGEEIAVRKTSDRFSLGHSYRVFANRLIADAPPWTVAAVAPAIETKPQPVESPASSPLAIPVIQPAPVPSPGPHAVPPPRPAPVPEASRTKIFISYARDDRERVQRIALAFEEQGWDVWFDSKLRAGENFSQAVEQALDRSDVIVVCWSKSSVMSEWVRTEADEGARRGVLIPVLLDDVVPPLGFRQLQSADLRRDDERSLERLVHAVRGVAEGRPGSSTAAPTPSMLAPAPSQSRSFVAAAIGIAAAILVGVSGLLVWTLSDRAPLEPPLVTPLVTVPNFVGAQTSDVKKTSDLVKLALMMRDSMGNQADYFDGVVTAQSPQAGQLVPPGAQIQLTVATAVVEVPTIVGGTLDAALRRLQEVGLRLGRTESRVVNRAKPGSVLDQTPQAGMKVAAGSAIDVIVASERPEPPETPVAPVRVGGQIRAPKKIKHVEPVYPPIAQSARVQGVVIVEAVIGPDGKVSDARILRSIPLLDQAALDAVRQWEFTPTLLKGKPVPVIMTTTVSFTLS
jgi:TonB family protein